MAQTKSRSSKRTSGSGKPQARSRGSTSKTSSSPKTRSGSSKAKSSSNKSSNKAKGSSSRSSSSKPKGSARGSNGSGRVESARRALEATAKGAGSTAKGAGQSVGRAAGKAKVPLVAGGAALMGAAGGLALGTRSRHAKGIVKAMSRRPRVKMKSSDLVHAAQEVGNFGTQMGRLASELQSAREENGKGRSPVEVVLDGLTARRSG
jgi:hypothetical protein